MRNFLFTVSALLLALVMTSAAQVAGRGGAQVTLPDGTGKELVQTTCSKCHGLNMVTGSGGYSRQEWDQLVSSMVSLPKEQQDTIASYLGKNFPDKGRPGPVIIEGKTKVEIHEWVVPSLGSRPHDPL